LKQLLKSQKNKVLLLLIILLQHHLQNPLDLGADVMHSTKYLAGHSDVMAGALIMKEELGSKCIFNNLLPENIGTHG
jgi:cystathionine beta-lyase